MGFLRDMFGPGKDEIWQQFSQEIQGKFSDGGLWKGDRVEVRHGQWNIVLDTHRVSHGKSSTTYTRLRAPFINKEQFRFTIYRQGFMDALSKIFGMQDIEVGHEQFDHDFVIKSNDEKVVKALFDNARIRELLHQLEHVELTIKDDDGRIFSDFPREVDVLQLRTQGVVKDLPRLHELYELLAETLTQLCKIGSAYDHDPGVSLR